MPDHSQLKEAFREAFDREYSQRLRAPGVEPITAAYVLVVVVLVIAAVAAAVVAAVTVLAAVYAWVTVSGPGGGGRKRKKDPGLSSLYGLAVQTGNPDLSRDVHAQLIDEMSRALGEAAIEAADAHGVRLSPDEAERQVRNVLARVMP